MDPYVRFNQALVDERQIDTLIGLSKGIIADGVVTQAEAEVLLAWLASARELIDEPIVAGLLPQVRAMLADHVLDADEARTLLATLRRLVGDESEPGEMRHATTLPLNDPPPHVTFAGRHFVFTGTCAFGTRAQCEAATVAQGGIVFKNISRHIEFLVLGTYVTDSWVHESYGRKIESAMRFRNDGAPLAIISEAHWAQSGRLGQIATVGTP